MTNNSFDAIVIGAGIAGMYQLHSLRERGLDVQGTEAGSDVGGTWYWNRYPGARLDSPGEVYQYWFSEELYKNWPVRERFSAQADVEAWLHYVADELDLRRHFRFGTRVESACFEEGLKRWKVTTDAGDILDAQFLVTCVGMLSAPLSESVPRAEDVQGSPVPHRAVAQGEGRVQRQARRHVRLMNFTPLDPEKRQHQLIDMEVMSEQLGSILRMARGV